MGISRRGLFGILAATPLLAMLGMKKKRDRRCKSCNDVIMPWSFSCSSNVTNCSLHWHCNQCGLDRSAHLLNLPSSNWTFAGDLHTLGGLRP